MTYKLLPRVLMIEDDRDQILLYRTFFDLDGSIDFLVCDNGRDGVAQAYGFKPDLILLDLKLEDRDGLELLKELKKQPQSKDIPVVVFTNLTEKGLTEKVFALGAFDYWLKTEVMPAELLKRIKVLVKDAPTGSGKL